MSKFLKKKFLPENMDFMTQGKIIVLNLFLTIVLEMNHSYLPDSIMILCIVKLDDKK